MIEKIIDATDGYKICVHIFKVDNSKGVVQLIHGMEEHQDRYLDFVKYLNNNGYSVVTSDLRGHGKNAPLLGFFADKNGDKLLVQDQILVRNMIREEFGETKVFMFAHSMGSIIARNILKTNSKDYEKVVLSGYPCYRKDAKFGLFITNIIKLFKGKKKVSKFIEYNSVGVYNKYIKDAKTDTDWICANYEVIESYKKDPLCGNPFTIQAYIDLFKLTISMNKKNNYNDVNQELKLLLVSGKEDPVTGFEEGKKSSLEQLSTNFKNIKVIDYDGLRHELLNELEHIKVYVDVSNFYDE